MRVRRPDGLAITNVNVIDVDSGTILPGQTILIADGRIADVGPGKRISIDRGIRTVNGRGDYVIPGLWDMHVHIADRSYLPLFVANGITGVRDMGGGVSHATDGCESVRPEMLGEWRSQIQAGRRVGPRIRYSGPAVSGTGWPTSLPARTGAEATLAVAKLQALRVDFVKVYDGIPRAAFERLARDSRAAGLPFAGHIPEDVGPLDAILAGQRSIEHLRDPLLVCFSSDPQLVDRFFARDGWSAQDVAWGRAAHRRCPALISALHQKDTWLTPTLTVEKAKVAVEDDAFVRDLRRGALPAPVQSGFAAYVREKRAQGKNDRASEHLWWRTQQILVRRLNGEGIKFLAGTDTACQGGLPGTSLHRELQELVIAGLSPLQALQSATRNPADYFGQPGAGSVRRGAPADLLLLGANPLQDIRNSQEIRSVVLAGKYLSREDLDRLAGEQAKAR